MNSTRKISNAPIEDISTLGPIKSSALGAQHVFTLFASTVLVPILTGLDVGVALVMCGIGTLLFHFITKFKVPAYLSSSFSSIAPIILAAEMYDLYYARGGISASAARPRRFNPCFNGILSSTLISANNL